MPFRVRYLEVFILVLAAISAAAIPARATDYVGSQACRTCHSDLWSTFYRNPHFKSLASGKEKPENTGCEGCHGPASDHVAAGGGSDTIPNAFSRMSQQKILDTCLKCHAETISRSN